MDRNAQAGDQKQQIGYQNPSSSQLFPCSKQEDIQVHKQNFFQKEDSKKTPKSKTGWVTKEIPIQIETTLLKCVKEAERTVHR